MQHLAGFLTLGSGSVSGDYRRRPAGVDGGRLHDFPFASVLRNDSRGRTDDGANYIRNAVKATVDAYTGKISLYVFDPDDPIIQAYENLFPKLFQPASRHARRLAPARPLSGSAVSARRRRPTAPFTCAIRRCSTTRKTSGTSRTTCSASPAQPENVQPTYVVATLPGRKSRSFC